MTMATCCRYCLAPVALLAAATSAQAQVGALRITEVDPFSNVAEVTNTGTAFTVSPAAPFCHEFLYGSFVPAGTIFAAGQIHTFPVNDFGGLPNDDSDLWLYRNSISFELVSNLVHGLKYGPAPGVGRTGLATTAVPPLWPSDSVFCPAPPPGMTLAYDGFGFTPFDWYIDQTPTMGSADSTTPGVVETSLAAPSGAEAFESVSLGDEVTALTGWLKVDTSLPGRFTVRAVNDVAGVTGPRPGSASTRWLRVRDQDDGAVQNRFYSNTITTGGDFNYTWTFWINLEETPPGGADGKPRIVVQHIDGGFQNAWGVEFTATGANVVVTGAGGPEASAPLYALASPTGIGDWVKLELSVDFAGATVSASANDGPPVALNIAPSVTFDRGTFRFCYRGEGIGNINTMLVDDVSLDVDGPAPLPEIVEFGELTIRLKPVVTGLASPVALTHAGDGSGRLFIVEQVGQIRVVDADGNLMPGAFLDVAAELPSLGTFFDERGLLGLAFHPDFQTNGRLFIRHSHPRPGLPEESCNDPDGFIVGCHEEMLVEYGLLNANQADPASRRILFRVDEPEFNHNAGTVAFGPDDYLYFSLGDGGGANDGLDNPALPHGPIGNGQNIETALGSVLRIDVDAAPTPPLEYAIPADNPFVGAPGLDEIYAYGFRNPFKFSFDDGPGGDGKLIVADVGQNRIEEIDYVVNGGNYGWVIKEGNQCFDPFNPTQPPLACPDTGAMSEPLIGPVAEYDHANGDGISVIGGHVYRGSRFPALSGLYVFGDFSTSFGAPNGKLYYLDADNDPSLISEFNLSTGAPLGLFVKGFGEDEDGEIYLLASTQLGPFGSGGGVFRIVPAKGDVNGDGAVDFDDVDALVAVLTGIDTDPHRAEIADIDDNGAADGLDVASFVALLLE